MLEHIKLSNSYIDEALMSELLEWLPTTTKLLELERMRSLEILEPLNKWLERSASRFRGLTIKISFDQARIEAADYEEDLWDEDILTAEQIMDSAARQGVKVIPADLAYAVWLMRPETGSASEDEDASEDDEEPPSGKSTFEEESSDAEASDG